MLALDLDPSRGDVDGQAADLGQLLERLGILPKGRISPARDLPGDELEHRIRQTAGQS